MPSLPDLSSTTVHTAFRQAEKHFKNRAIKDVLPSLRPYQDVLVDLSRPIDQDHDEVWKAGWWSPESDQASIRSTFSKWRKGKQRDRGERPNVEHSDLDRITLLDGTTAWIVGPGCIIIPEYLSGGEQLSLLRSSLAEYTRPPNPLSLSTHYDLPPDLFQLYTVAPDTLVQPKHAVSETSKDQPISVRLSGTRQLIETEPASVLGYEEVVARNKTWTGDVASDRLSSKTVDRLMHQLRWANLGWVYQWSTKSYDFSARKPIPFPPELAKICSDIVATIPWAHVFHNDNNTSEQAINWAAWPDDYAPDTGIVNFYQMNDTLMGHVDRAELDPSRPLVSVSLGHSAILLLGTASRQDRPRPIILRSGDVLIMSGRGRQAYHGVPRIMEGTLPAHFSVNEVDEAEMKAAKIWISSGRININARQVFPPGFERP